MSRGGTAEIWAETCELDEVKEKDQFDWRKTPESKRAIPREKEVGETNRFE